MIVQKNYTCISLVSKFTKNLGQVLKVFWEFSVVVFQRTFSRQKFDESTVIFDFTGISLFNVFFSVQVGETPFFRQNDFLLTWELVSGSSQSFNNNVFVGVFGSTRENNLTNVNSGSQTVRFTPSTSHTLLQSIGTGTRQHFVDSQNMEWMDSDSQMESISPNGFGDVFVSTNTSSFQSFRRQLFQFVGNQMNTQWKFINSGLFFTQIENSDFWIWNSSVVSRFWVRFVFLVSVTSSWSSSHLV